MKALYISDNPEEWERISRMFKANYPKVPILYAHTGKMAQDLMTCDGPFGMILIEATIKGESPTEVIKQLLELNGNRPVIFLGPKSYIETRITNDVFSKHEANQILYRPFVLEDFKDKIDSAINWVKKEEFEQSIMEINYEDFMPMKLKNFYLYEEIPYDAYLEVAENKVIKIISKNKKYYHSKISNYAQKGVKYLYIRTEESLKLLNSALLTIGGELSTRKNSFNVDDDDKVRSLLELQIKGIAVIQQILQNLGTNENLLKVTAEIIDSGSYLFDWIKTPERLIKIFPFKDHDVAESSLLTFYVSLSILSSMKWDSNMSRGKMGLASIIHDCMLLNDQLNIVTGPKDPALLKFKAKERQDFLLHPEKAAKVGNAFSGYSDVDFIIEQHHEHPEGIGFPRGLTSFNITPMSAIFIIAVRFVHELNLQKNEKHPIKGILIRLGVLYNIGSFKEVIKSLERAFRK